MKKNGLLVLMVLIVCHFPFCTFAQSRGSTDKFIKDTQLSLLTPMQLYLQVNVENSERIIRDIYNESLVFEYNKKGNFLLRTNTNRDRIISTWGSQISLQNNRIPRQLIFTSFIAAAYALENGNDPLDTAFEVLKQILSKDAYKEYEDELNDVFKEGIKQYRTGGETWSIYKLEKFIVEKKGITIR